MRGREISGARSRALLALLAVDLRTGASTGRLVAGIWGEGAEEGPGKGAKGALQVLVSRTRAQLGADLIASTPTGYRLTLNADQIDATALEVRAAAAERHARAGDHLAALDQAEAGLALWGGDIGDAVETDPLSALRIERLPAFRSLSLVRALTLSRLGRYAEALGPLTQLMAQDPRNEDVLSELLRAEADTVGASVALVRYDKHRRALRDEFGANPGAVVQSVYRQLLRANEPVVRQGIPHDPNPLLGRSDAIAAVNALLRSARVVSLIGPGGLGKTRLAHAVGRDAEQRLVHLVPLAGVLDDGAVAAEVAGALGIGDAPATGQRNSVVAGIAHALGSAPALLILDNCEHVIEGAAALVSALVSLTPELKVLVTSRAPLGLSSEAVHLLPALTTDAAVELFGQRARAVRPDIELPRHEVAELCAHLDGLPLAIELAAARARVMSVAEVSRRLADRFALLRTGSRDAPRRHRTLHAVVDWSWNLLDEDGRAAMRLLSIFPGGFAVEAADRLLGGEVGETWETLEHLAEQSLIQIVPGESRTRFRMLETVREFATARREEAGEEERALDGFLTWARDFGLSQTGSAFSAWPAPTALSAEQDNLVRALRHGLDRADGQSVAAVLSALGPWWYVCSHYARIAEVAGECAWVLSHYRPEPTYVDATRTAAAICALSGVTQGGFELRSLLVLRRLPAAPANTLMRAVATVFVAAPELLGPDTEALDQLCANPQPLLAGVGHTVASFRAEQLGDRAEALAATWRMLADFERAPNNWMRYQARCRIGKLALLSEQPEQARDQLGLAFEVIEDLGPRPDRDDVMIGLAMAALQLGDIESAQNWLVRVPDSADPFARPYKLLADAEISLARGDIEEGLWRWRRIAELLADEENPFFRPDPRGVQVWALEGRSAAVLAHARAHRLDLVAGLVAELPAQLTALLESPATQPGGHLTELTACGAVLLALALVDLERGQHASAVRMIALAEHFDPPRQFHPTMSSRSIRECAGNADEAAYVEAISTYATLAVPELRAAALAALAGRTSDPARG